MNQFVLNLMPWLNGLALNLRAQTLIPDDQTWSPRSAVCAKLVTYNFSNTKSCTVDDVPDGYPKVAHFQNSDDAYMIFRRFGCVFSRLILYKQDELKCLEQTMQDLDELDHETEGWNENLKSRELDEHREPETIPGESRKKLMSQMEAKAIEYGQLHDPSETRALT